MTRSSSLEKHVDILEHLLVRQFTNLIIEEILARQALCDTKYDVVGRQKIEEPRVKYLSQKRVVLARLSILINKNSQFTNLIIEEILAGLALRDSKYCVVGRQKIKEPRVKYLSQKRIVPVHSRQVIHPHEQK